MSSTLTTERTSVRSQNLTEISITIGDRCGAVQVPQHVAEILLAAIDADGRSLEGFLLEDLSGVMYGVTTDALCDAGRCDRKEIHQAAALLGRMAEAKP